ncbi:GAF domain-containing sensor histidine kinase [Psychroflexus sp. CAK57W]|uniref:GAF domain-containing sensor histidine kinase n=1 Tax=Psychroflexus curvus TaxID=2873595 RepID=UPI001CCBD27D|nr:GAF domain-containing sensor histidine kinase [Psychroflexus curvus]MBZ9787291.1 GAF domain-containing sensor histidine kinase [Psychroflexus curvus]
MTKPPIPNNEAERLKELHSLRLIEGLPDEDLDLITKLASDICETKISLVTLIDSKTQFFKSKHGVEIDKTSRDVAFCGHAINSPEKMLIVNDAKEDERFKDNPLVTSDPNIAFYAGMPISTKQGSALGTLCVLDSKPKVLSTSQINALKSLTKLVERLFESRRKSLELEKVYTQMQLHKSQSEEIAYSIAHDLKNPLDSIQGFLELLQQDAGTSLGDEAQQYIEYAQQSTEKMTGLIYEILAFAKLTSINEEKEAVEIEPVIQNIIDLNLPTIKSENIEIDYKDLPKINTSKTLFSIVLRNLIGNAIKYRSSDRALRIKIEIQDKIDEWKISVVDNGIGIQKQNLEKIFKPFYKEDKNNHSGVGMGLAACKKIILNLDGNIEVESEPGKGSVFSFTIPK